MYKFLRKNWLIILSVIYIISPIDLIPDYIIGLGLADDLTIAIANILIAMAKNKRNSKSKE